MFNKATAKNAEKANNNHTLPTAALQLFAASLIIIFMLLIGAGRATAATATFVGSDATTQGNWQGKYGSDGYAIANSAQSIPSYAQLSVEYQMNWTWNNNTSDARALRLATGTSRIASAWYQPFNFTMDLNLTDGNSHQVAFYALDWDGGQRVETIQVVDATTGTLLDTRTISNFTNGIYLVWNLSGHVQVKVAHNGGSNGVLSGAFFGNGSGVTAPLGAMAPFLRSDVGTQGNWQTAYGSDGYSIATAAQSLPSYANFAVQNQGNWTWAASTSDPRALDASSGRTATTWYNGSSFSFDMNFVDGAAHTVALYALDYDSKGRSESIKIVDANSGASLNTQNISSFSGGMYLVYIIKGHVTVTVTSNGGPNAVVSGVFFGTSTASASQPVTTPVTTTTATSTSASASTYVLTSNANSISFGSVSVSNSSAQTATLTNSGTGTITISSLVIAGAGFNATGVSAGTVLQPGQSAALSITFAPASSGNVTGTILITSNASAGANTIALAGSGASQQHSVQISWAASSSGGIVGYNTYYSTISGGPYAKLTASPLSATAYTDSNVTAGETRYYVVTSVDSSHIESGYSQEVIAIVP
jgi:hypothetical protein